MFFKSITAQWLCTPVDSSQLSRILKNYKVLHHHVKSIEPVNLIFNERNLNNFGFLHARLYCINAYDKMIV